MPRRALRCVVDLSIYAVSAPGVWLPSKEDVYLSVSMFGQYRNSRLLSSVFPLLIHEKFRFEKTYYTALDPTDVADYLEDELVVFELVQLSEYTDGAIRLGSFSTNARDFLYPYPSLAPTYSSTDREILLARTVAFPGISPKLEFATKTVIKESISPEVDALEDALDQERERRTYRKTRRSPTRLARSPSPTRRVMNLDLSDTFDPRPPFVVRKLETSLIGRLPGGGPDSHAKSKPKKTKRVLSYSMSDTDCLCRLGRLCSVCETYKRYFGHPYSGHSFNYHPTGVRSPCQCNFKKVIREPVNRSKYLSDDEDAEVAELTSRVKSYTPRVRPRSASPLRYRPTFEARYGGRSYSPPVYTPITTSTSVADRVSALERSRRLLRLSELSSPFYYSRYWPYSWYYDSTYLPYRYRYPYYRDLLDLEIATNIAKSRRYLPLY